MATMVDGIITMDNAAHNPVVDAAVEFLVSVSAGLAVELDGKLSVITGDELDDYSRKLETSDDLIRWLMDDDTPYTHPMRTIREQDMFTAEEWCSIIQPAIDAKNHQVYEHESLIQQVNDLYAETRGTLHTSLID